MAKPRIVFDMSLISLIDSAGLESLLEARDRCRKLGGNLVLAHPNSLCSDILRINGFEKWISIYDSAVKALGSFAR